MIKKILLNLKNELKQALEVESTRKVIFFCISAWQIKKFSDLWNVKNYFESLPADGIAEEKKKKDSKKTV